MINSLSGEFLLVEVDGAPPPSRNGTAPWRSKVDDDVATSCSSRMSLTEIVDESTVRFFDAKSRDSHFANHDAFFHRQEPSKMLFQTA